MRKNIVLTVLFIVNILIFAGIQTNQNTLLSNFILEKTPFEVSGTVKEVVVSPRGFGYTLVTTDSGELKVPAVGQLISLLKSGTKVSVKGTKVTAFIPISLEADGYKVILKKRLPEDTEKVEISVKVKKIEIGRNYVNVVLVDEQGKDLTIPAALIPFWKNLKEGDEAKITGFKKTFELKESITVDGKTYMLPAQHVAQKIAFITQNRKSMPDMKYFKYRR
jgi:hypothetical protein